MANELVVRLRIGGVDEVERGLRTVMQAAERSEQQTKKRYDNESRAAVKAEREKLRERQRSEREESRMREAGYRQSAKVAADEVKAVEKAEKEKQRAIDKGEADKERRYRATARLVERLIHEEVQAVEKAEREKQRVREKYARAMGSGIGRSVGGVVHGAVRIAGTATMLGGGFSVADAMQKQFSLERSAGIFSNQTSSMPGGRVATKDIMSRARAVAIKNNVDPNEVAQGMSAYFAKASDVKGAMANADLFAQLSKATGTDQSTIATTAGALRVQNPNLDEKGMRNMLLGLVGQTRLGAVDLQDLAQHVPTITSTSALYAGDQALNQRKLIGLSQVGARTAGSSAEAAEAVQRFGSDVASNADKIKKQLGIDVKDKSGALKDPAEIIAALMQSTGGDIGKLKHAGIGRESMKLFEAEEQTFKGAGGGAGGATAVRKDISQFTEGGYDDKSLASDVENIMKSPAERFGVVTEKLTEKLEERLTPMIEKLADGFDEWEPKVEQIIDAFAGMVEWAGGHPMEAVVIALAAAVGKGAITTAVAEALKKAILGGGGGGGGPLGGGGGANGVAGAGGALAAVVEGGHLLGAGEAAYKTHESGRNWAATGHSYLESWQSGNAGWIGGAKWNPLVTLAKEGLGMLSDEGKIEPGENFHERAKALNQGLLAPPKGTLEYEQWMKNNDPQGSHATSGPLMAAVKADPQTGKDMLSVLKEISKKLDNTTGKGPNDPNRNHSLSHPARGGT
jgi:hypothetical protein